MDTKIYYLFTSGITELHEQAENRALLDIRYCFEDRSGVMQLEQQLERSSNGSRTKLGIDREHNQNTAGTAWEAKREGTRNKAGTRPNVKKCSENTLGSKLGT